MASNKRICLSLEVKCEILKEVDSKATNKTAIAKKYGIPKNTLSTIIKNKEKIRQEHSKGIAPGRKYSREAKYPELEKALIAWLKVMRGKGLPIDGPILKEKAETFALRLDLDNFKASDGWLQKFKLRHGLSFRKMCGESAAVNLAVTNEWKENQLQTILSEYPPEDVFNADETGLFFKLLPDRTLVFKNESCNGGKRAKQRITVMLASNMTGTEKLPLLIIGKYLNPRCFKNIRHLPATYYANSKAWMTSAFFEKWLRDVDQFFLKKKRKIVLVVDNCTAHVGIQDLKAVCLEYLPPNVTSVLQPMDQGIIQCFKRKYRSMLLKRVLLSMENGRDYDINLLSAMHLAVRAWDDIQPEVIANCFSHAGFFKSMPVNEAGEEGLADCKAAEAKEDAVLFEAFKGKNIVPENVAVKDYFNVDEAVQCIENISDEDIIEQALESHDKGDSSDDGENNEPQPRPTLKEAADSVSVLRRFFESSDSENISIMKHIDCLESSVFKCAKFSQSKITEYFCQPE